ncbi:MAG: flagellar export chaperone FliS [Phycisphaerales bacterium]|nr:flagellar export chaperone FliS [Phycisphaerales bacterium]
MNDQNTANAYLKTKVMTASPEELRMMLLDGAIRFANTAKYGLENDDYEKIYEGFTQCRDIVLELTNTIDPTPNPELADKIKSIYVFLYGELVSASVDKDLDRLNKAIELLEFERETWAQLMIQLVEDRKAGIVATPNLPDINMPSLSIQA